MMTIPTLVTKRLIMRPPGPEGFDAFAAFYASEASSFVMGPMSREAAWRAYAANYGHWGLRGYGRWTVEEKSTGAACGMVGLWYPLGWPEPEVGWMIYEGHGGKGYATEAAHRSLAFAYEDLGWSTAISLIDPANARSIALAERMGARLDGEFEHERFGLMAVYRHPSPTELSGEAAA